MLGIQAERDYQLLSADTPSWKGNLAVGHGGTYQELNGGKFGVAATRYLLQWTLKGDTTAAEFFTGEEATQEGWVVESMNLNKITAEAAIVLLPSSLSAEDIVGSAYGITTRVVFRRSSDRLAIVHTGVDIYLKQSYSKYSTLCLRVGLAQMRCGRGSR